MRLSIYTDGATSFNGMNNAVGGWAYAVIDEHNCLVHSDSGRVNGATNQQMELTAILRACSYAYTDAYAFLNDYGAMINIYSDSAYVINNYEQQWWTNWEKNDWKNAKKEPVANKELWEELIPYFKHPCFCFYKVKGHSNGNVNNEWNNYVDKLAVEAKKSI